MKIYEIDSNRLFKVIEIGQQKRVEKLKNKAIIKQKWVNFKKRVGL